MLTSILHNVYTERINMSRRQTQTALSKTGTYFGIQQNTRTHRPAQTFVSHIEIFFHELRLDRGLYNISTTASDSD